jgi:adenylate kinase
MDIILFGMQGSGKGTQGKSLAAQYNLKVFDIGTQFRKEIQAGTSLGLSIKAPVESGHLVDDEIVMCVVEDVLSKVDPNQPLLFDGVPRTLSQVDKLLELLAKFGRDAFAVNIKISEGEGTLRLTKRRICPDCHGIYPPSYKEDKCEHCGGTLITRTDDNPESIHRRIENYKKQTVPVIKTFYDRDRLIDIDGEQPIDVVTKEALEKVGYLFI